MELSRAARTAGSLVADLQVGKMVPQPFEAMSAEAAELSYVVCCNSPGSNCKVQQWQPNL